MRKITGLSSNELEELEYLVTKNIVFLKQDIIPVKTLIYTEILLEKIDIDDAPFVALAKHLKAKLWTGDKILSEGLKRNNFIVTISTSELTKFLDRL
jgi:predicted nucleic acid-binding protein